MAAPSRGDGPRSGTWDWVRDTTNVRTLVDIGANDGAHSEYLSGFFGPGAVHVFEPLPSCQPSCPPSRPACRTSRCIRSRWPRRPEATFFENGYGPASSLLRVGDVSPAGLPRNGARVGRDGRAGPTRRRPAVDTLERDIMIKIDVQGAEDRSSRAAEAVFSAAKIVLVEMAFVPIYQGQPLFEEVHGLLEACGLRLAGFKNQIEQASGPASRCSPTASTTDPTTARQDRVSAQLRDGGPRALDPRAGSSSPTAARQSRRHAARGRWRSTA